MGVFCLFIQTSTIEPKRKQKKKKMKEMWEKIQSKVYNSTGNSDISKPMMVFSIIGDANSFAPRPWQTIVFQTALIEAAKNGGGKVLIQGILMAFISYFLTVITTLLLCTNINMIDLRRYHVQNNKFYNNNAVFSLKHDVNITL